MPLNYATLYKYKDLPTQQIMPWNACLFGQPNKLPKAIWYETLLDNIDTFKADIPEGEWVECVEQPSFHIYMFIPDSCPEDSLLLTTFPSWGEW